MTLEVQTADINFGKGSLDLKTDPQMLAPPMLSRADNVVYSTDGALRQRLGHSLATTHTSFDKTKVTALFPTREGNVGYVQTNGAGRNLTNNVGSNSLQPTYGRTPQLPFGSGLGNTLVPAQNLSTCFTSNPNQVVMAWDYDLEYYTTSATHKRVVYYGIWNTQTSTWDLTPRQLTLLATFTADVGVGTVTGAAQPMVFGFNNQYFTIVFSAQFTNGGNTYTQVVAARVDFFTPAQPVAWNKVTGTQQGPLAGGIYTLPSVCPLPGQTGGSGNPTAGIFAWSPLAGATNGKLVRVTTSTGAVTDIIALTGTIGQTRPVTCCYYDGSGSTSYTTVFVSDTSNMASYTWSSTFTLVTGPVANGMGGGTTQGQLICGRNSSANSTFLAVGTRTGTAVGMGAPTVVIANPGTPPATNTNSWGYVSQIFIGPTNQPCAWLCYNGNITGSLQNTFLCVNLNNNTVIGRAAYLAANPLQSVPQPVLGQSTDGGVYPSTFVFLSGGSLSSNGGGATSATTYLNSQVASPQATILKASWGATQTVELPNGTMTSGLAPAFITEQDGYELGFSYSPELDSTGASLSIFGAGANVVGIVQYMVAYRWIDSYNQVHWSAPSAQASINAGAGSLIQLPAIPSTPGVKGTAYWFRTKNGGTTFYQLFVGGGVTVDGTTDANLNPQFIYTTGGEVANDPPPSCALVAATSQRAFAVSAENPTQLFYSKPFRVGRPVEWSGQQFMFVAPNTGAITSLAVLDDKLIIFKGSTIYLLSGDNGSVTAPQFYGPSPIAALSGCTNPGSIVSTDMGVFFQSARGIDLLKRDLTTEYVGQPLDGAIGNITSTAVVPLQGHVRFLDLTNSCAWVFDVLVGRWSKFTYYDGTSSFTLPSYSIITGVTSAGTIITAQGVLTESSTFLDAANQVFPVAETGHIPVSAIHQGFGRLRRLALLATGRNGGAAATNPKVDLAYDYSATYTDTLQGPSVATGTGSPYQFRSRVPRQRMEAVRFRITWPTAYNLSEQMSLTGLSLEIGIKQGIYKLAATSSV